MNNYRDTVGRGGAGPGVFYSQQGGAPTGQLMVAQPVYPNQFGVSVSGIVGVPGAGRILVAKAPNLQTPATQGWHLWKEEALNGITSFGVIIPTDHDYFPGDILNIAAEFTDQSGSVLSTGVPGQGGYNPSLFAAVRVGGTNQNQQGSGGDSNGLLVAAGIVAVIGGIAYARSKGGVSQGA